MKPARLLSLVLALAFGAPAGAQTAHSSAAPPAASGATLLRMNYANGHAVSYSMRTTQSAGQSGTMTSTGGVEITTTAVQPDGSARQRLRITSMAVTGPSVTEETNHAIASAVSGLAMQYTQNNRGQVTDRQAPANVAPELAPLVEGLLQSVDQMSPLLPEAPVAIGATWTDHRATHLAVGPGGQLSMNLDLTYTLREVRPAARGPVIVLALATAMSIGGGARSAVTGTGSATGTMTVDLGQGSLMESHSRGTMHMRVAPAGRAPMNVDTTFESDMRPTH